MKAKDFFSSYNYLFFVIDKFNKTNVTFHVFHSFYFSYEINVEIIEINVLFLKTEFMA